MFALDYQQLLRNTFPQFVGNIYCIMRFLYVFLLASLVTAITKTPAVEVETVQGMVGRILGEVRIHIY